MKFFFQAILASFIFSFLITLPSHAKEYFKQDGTRVMMQCQVIEIRDLQKTPTDYTVYIAEPVPLNYVTGTPFSDYVFSKVSRDNYLTNCVDDNVQLDQWFRVGINDRTEKRYGGAAYNIKVIARPIKELLPQWNINTIVVNSGLTVSNSQSSEKPKGALIVAPIGGPETTAKPAPKPIARPVAKPAPKPAAKPAPKAAPKKKSSTCGGKGQSACAKRE